jgi:hypothetical protein
MVAIVATASKCREKTKKPIVAGELEEVPPPYMPPIHLCHQPPAPHLHL